MDEQMDEQMEERMDKWMDERMDEWMDERMDEQMNEPTDQWMYEWTDEWIDEETEWQTNGQMDRQMDQWMNGRTDRHPLLNCGSNIVWLALCLFIVDEKLIKNKVLNTMICANLQYMGAWSKYPWVYCTACLPPNPDGRFDIIAENKPLNPNNRIGLNGFHIWTLRIREVMKTKHASINIRSTKFVYS